jgi:ubiquinone/menaquinone biosynthesis C-methylase UbiE
VSHGDGSEKRALTARVRAYWNEHIHDLTITRHPPGSPQFFRDLDEYHFDKLHHLLTLIPFEGLAGRRVLDLGCGTGVDLARFARGNARAVGVDLSESAIRLARQNVGHQRLPVALLVADGEQLPFPDNQFDYVFAHGVVQYTANGRRLVDEVRRVMKPGAEAVFQGYNRISWLNALSKLMKVDLEHEHAPVLHKYTPEEFRRAVDGFSEVRLVYERFPVKSRLHGGWKGFAFNTIFVGAFNALPRRWVERYGWHLLAFCRK